MKCKALRRNRAARWRCMNEVLSYAGGSIQSLLN